MFRIIFDILHGLLPPLLRLFLGIGIPVFIIGVICFVIKLLIEYAIFQMNHKKIRMGIVIRIRLALTIIDLVRIYASVLIVTIAFAR